MDSQDYDLVCAIRENDRKWRENEEQYKRRQLELTQEHHLLTVDLILFFQSKGYSNEEIKQLVRETING